MMVVRGGEWKRGRLLTRKCYAREEWTIRIVVLEIVYLMLSNDREEKHDVAV